MTAPAARHPGAGPEAFALGRFRLRVAIALAGALGLHAALLVSPRPTLIDSAPREAVPMMIVRMLAQGPATAMTASTPPDVLITPPVRLAAVRQAVQPSPQSGAGAVGRAAEPPDSHVTNVLLPTGAPAPPPSAPPTATLPTGLPPAPAYLSAGRLDPGPKPLEDVEPDYPEEAKLQEGSVVLRLLINEGGTVDNVAVVRAYPTGLFEQSALDAFGKTRFSPGMILGVPVKSQITIEVSFTPINRGARVSGRSY